MSVAINNRFGVLLAEKRGQEKRNIPLSEVSEAIGVPPKTLLSWANNTVTRFDAHVIDAICQYFSVQPGELFEYVPNPPDPKKKK
jgi:DNA-binding Xre family transcriptional regulator